MSDIYASVSTTSNLSAGINSKNNLKATVGNNSSLSASLNPSQSIQVSGATVGNAYLTILTPAQPNITSVGTLTSLNVSGDISVATAPTSGNHLTNKTYVDTQLAITSSSLTTHEGLTNNPHSVTAAQIGLGNVEDKSAATIIGEIVDSDIPSTIARDSELSAHTSLTNNPHSVTATQVGLGNVTNESKATMFTDPTFTGNPQSNAAPGSGDHLTNKTYVDTQVAGIVDSAPAALDTLNELSAALNDSPSQINNILTAVGERLVIANNLSDLNDTSIARTNLGLGTSNNVTFNSVGINKTPDRTLDMDGHFRLLITPENRIVGQSSALIKGTNARAATLRVVGPVTVTHDLFKNSGDTGGFGDNSNHFHTIQKINRITNQSSGEVKNIERVQEQYYAIENNLLRGSNAAFWNWHRVSRSIDNTPVDLSDLSGWNVSHIQHAPTSGRNNSAQVPFTTSENTIFTFNTSAGNPFVLNDLLQIKIDIDFEGAIVAATLFAKVHSIGSTTASVHLFGGNYKSTDEVPSGTSQTALTTNFSVNKIDTTNALTLTSGINAGTAHQKSFRNLLGGQIYRTGHRVIRLNLAAGHGLEINDVITIITNGIGNYKNAEVAFIETTGSTRVTAVYGRIFDSDPDLPTSLAPQNIIAVLKGTLDGLHRINAGDTLMNFNSDNAGRYKSFHIGPGTEVDGNCISIGKNVYNNIDKSIRIGYEPGDYGNHLLITPTYTETLKPLSTTGIQAARIGAEQEIATDLHYDSANHFFRDFDEVPNDMMVIKRRTDTGAGSSIGMVGINNDSPIVALHVLGQTGSDGTTNEVFRAIGSGLFTSKNNIALHLKVDTDNNEATGGLGGSTILKLQQDSTNETATSSERINLGFIGTGGGGIYTDSTAEAAYIEVENNKPFEIATGNNKSLSINSLGYASFRNRVGIGDTTPPAYTLDLANSSGDNTIRLVSKGGGTAIRIGAGGAGNNVTLLRVDGSTNNNRGNSNSGNYGFSMVYYGAGSGNANALRFVTDNQVGTQIDALNILQDGKIGIGTISPSETLDVGGQFTVRGDNGAVTAGGIIRSTHYEPGDYPTTQMGGAPLLRSRTTAAFDSVGNLIQDEKVIAWKLTGAQMKALTTTNDVSQIDSSYYKILDAPGANKVIVVRELELFIDYSPNIGLFPGKFEVVMLTPSTTGTLTAQGSRVTTFATIPKNVLNFHYADQFDSQPQDTLYVRDAPSVGGRAFPNTALYLRPTSNYAVSTTPGSDFYFRLTYKLMDLTLDFDVTTT